MKRLIRTYDKTVTNLVDEALYLAALNVEEAMLTAGGRPGIDYTFLDVFNLATKLAPAMWPDIGDMDRTTGIPAEHPHSSDLFQRVSIAQLRLSVRAFQALDAEGITDIDQLCSMAPAQLLRIPNLGNSSLAQIRRRLKEVGLSLQEPIRD